ncbi:MAG: TlyA family RNA methyltransferase, partial [Oscillospiraceae bacterium]
MVLRLDMLLVSLNLVKSRERAKEMIKQSLIKVDGKIVNKPSVQVDETSAVQLLGNSLQYVGRGGLKLEKAINVFNLDFLGKVCIDIGASTGGFTDCMLQNGAKKVYAIDVGHSQLDKKLLDDSRVINLEKTNIREVNDYIFDEKIDFITIDVSFISLKLVLPKVKEILKNGEFVALIKPQFEAGKADVGKKGIVKSPKIHIKVLEEIVQLVGINFAVKALDFSPISGG